MEQEIEEDVKTEEDSEEERDWAAEAKTLGWHDPEDEDFRGDPEKALSAEDFVKKGEEELPIVRENNRKLHRKINEEKADRAVFKAFMDSQMEAQQKEYEQKLREAAANGDIEAYDKIRESQPQNSQTNGELQNEIRDFQSRNAWYGLDDLKTNYAKFMDDQIANQGLSLTPRQHFDKVEEAVLAQFPDKKPAPQTVERARKRSASPATKNYAAMPSVNRAVCDRMSKKYGVNKDDYVKNYWNDEEKKDAQT